MNNVKQSSRAQNRNLCNSDENVGEEYIGHKYSIWQNILVLFLFLYCIYSNQTGTIAFHRVLRCNTPLGSRGLHTNSLIHSVTINQLILLFRLYNNT